MVDGNPVEYSAASQLTSCNDMQTLVAELYTLARRATESVVEILCGDYIIE